MRENKIKSTHQKANDKEFNCVILIFLTLEVYFLIFLFMHKAISSETEAGNTRTTTAATAAAIYEFNRKLKKLILNSFNAFYNV